MPHALISHAPLSGTTAVAYTGAGVGVGTWQQAPLDSVFTLQVNNDGSPANFATVANNQVTISSGIYRIDGFSIMYGPTAAKYATRLFNVTANAPAWVGKPNEISATTIVSVGVNIPVFMTFNGVLTLLAPTTFEIQGLGSSVAAGSNFGLAKYNVTTFPVPKEVYRLMDIIKTA